MRRIRLMFYISMIECHLNVKPSNKDMHVFKMYANQNQKTTYVIWRCKINIKSAQYSAIA